MKIGIQRFIVVGATLLLLSACGKATPVEKPAKPPGLEAVPSQVALRCVTPGCETVETVRINVNGTRRVAIKRVLIEGDTAGEFTVETSEAAPFILGENTGFDATVHYVPQGAPMTGTVELRVTYTDASPEESADRLEPGELVVPLVRRLVGLPELVASPEALSFGFVPSGAALAQPLKMENVGFGNISLELTGIEAGHASVRSSLPAKSTLTPGEHTEVPVAFVPQEESYVSTTVSLRSTSSDTTRSSVRVEGTSIPTPRIAQEPLGDFDFGELPKGTSRKVTVVLVNQGGSPLVIDNIDATDSSGNVTLEGDAPGVSRTLAPLQRLPLVFQITGTTPSEVNVQVEVASNDSVRPLLVFHLRGTVTEPRVTLSPTSIDFGSVPVGWVVKRPVEIRNTGYGALALKNLKMVGGSSSLFTVTNLPALPHLLARDERIAVEVEFRAETAASFTGSLSIETSDPGKNFAEVALQAVAGSCASSCPIAHGTASCTNGTCSVGACNAGYFNTDGAASNGCECKEIDTDPGEFCTGAKYVGALVDNNKDQVSHSGVLPEDGDVDLIRFFADDAFAAFDENFHVKVQLSSSDPDIKFCVYRRDVGSHDDDCYFTNESCPTNRFYEKKGGGGGGDDADFTVKVFRVGNTAPTCKSYTLTMSNGL